MPPINIPQANKELHKNQTPDFLSHVSPVVRKRLFLVTAAPSVMIAALVFFGISKTTDNFLLKQTLFQCGQNLPSTIQLLWVDTKELITELEISGRLWLCWLPAHKPKCHLSINTFRDTRFFGRTACTALGTAIKTWSWCQ